MTRLKYLDPADGLYKLLPVGGGGIDEVWVGPTAPTDPNAELWYDTSAVQAAPPSGPTVVSAQAGNQSKLGTDGFLFSQTKVYADAAARTAAFPSPADGDMTYVTNYRQFQSYRSDLGLWLPVAGEMPYANATETANQAITANTVTRMTFQAANAGAIGGMAFTDATDHYTGPRGYYHIFARAFFTSATAGTVEMYYGDSAGAYTQFGGGTVVGSQASSIYANTIIPMPPSGTGITVWFWSSLARTISYKTFTLYYLGQP